jgi:glycerophosphoryl diester phosphodiesterase
MMGSLSRRRLLGYTAAGIVLGGGPLTSFAQGAVPMRQRPVKPLIMGHRGCSALRPEHTLGSYAKAIADGADFIEPDLVPTRDGVLIARHENNIAETTDVAAHGEFAGRRTTKVVDGEQITGWFTEDFTLAEIKTLRAKERLEGMRSESHSYDGQFQVVTLEEIADFAAAESAARGRQIGIIPEIKHSTYFAGIGLPMEQRFLDRLHASHYLSTAPVIVQSFEIANLKALRPRLPANVQTMQLIGDPDQSPADFVKAGDKRVWRDLFTPAALAEMASYADWFSPATRLYRPLGKDGRLLPSTGLAEAARRAGMLVGCWTFRPENHFLAADFRNDAPDGARNPEGSLREIAAYVALGLDGFFTDDPALGRKVVDAMI